MHPSKAKGNRLEREVVKIAQDSHLVAERAYGSNGKALGMAEDVDVKIDSWRADDGPKTYAVQCKSRKSIADYIKPPESCDFTVVKENRGEPLAVIPLKKLLELL
tara:strand:- start:1663 stop:1977 length:315 start_codon:yes stop_codon:yes gene_type:complete